MADPIDSIAAAMAQEQKTASTPPIEYGDELAPLVRMPAFRAPQPVPAVDEDEQLARQMADEQKQENAQQAQLLGWRAKNDKVDAGVRADVLRYSAASGLHPDFVEKNLDGVKSKVDSDKVDWNQVAYRQPALVKFLLEQPEMTPLVKDDAAELKGIEWAIKAPLHALGDAIGEQVTVARQFGEAYGIGSADNRERIDELEKLYSGKDYGADTFVQQGVIAAFRMAPYILGDSLARGAGGAVGAGVVAGEGAGAGAVAGAPAAGAGAAPGAAVGTVAGGVAGAAVGQFVGSALFNYYQALGPLHARLSKLKDANGIPMEPEVVDAFAQAGAGAQGLLMAGFMGKVGGKIPGVKQLIGKFVANPIEKALTQTTVTRALGTNALKFGQHWLTGGVMMATQSALNAATVESAKASSRQPFEVQYSNISEAAVDGFKTGMADMWLISALGPGRDMIRDVGRTRSSALGAQQLATMIAGAEASKLLERYPEGFEKALEKMAGQEGANSTVYIPADEWTAYWQPKKVDPGEMAGKVMGDDGKGFAEATNRQGDLAIPASKFFAVLGKTEHAAGLAENAKLRPDDFTPKQLKEETKRQEKRLKEEAKIRGSELQAGKTEVLDFIRDQATAAGISKEEAKNVAKLVSESAGTMALRLGVSVPEAAALGSLGHLRILGPKGEGVAAAARERFARFLRPEAAQLLEQRLATLDPEGRAKEYYLDEDVSGLRNRRVFDALPAPEGTQVAAISSPHIKDINDNYQHGGHELLNSALLRVMGQAIGEHNGEGQHGPAAARGGTSFFVHVKDQAELDQVLARVRKAVGNDNIAITAGLGATSEAAGKAEGAYSDSLRTEATPEAQRLPPRGTPDPRLDVSTLKPSDKKHEGATVPQHLVEQLGAMKPREYSKLAYLDKVKVGGVDVETGLLSGEGWRAIPRKLHAVAFDLRNLKLANLAGGKLENGHENKEGGQALLLRFARTAAHLGGTSFDMAHPSGDEYVAQSNDPVALERFVDRLNQRFEGLKIRVENPSTGVIERVPVAFRYGYGPDYGKADRDLNRRKQLEGPPNGGDRVPGRADLGTGDVGGGVGSPAQGSNGEARSGGDRGRGQEEPGRPQGDGRGARPQNFVEVATYFDGAAVTIGPEGEGRGNITMKFDPAGSGRPVAFDIRVLNGDKSTAVHEIGHFLGWSLHNIATSDLATPSIRSDYAGLLKWAGYETPAQRAAETRERTALERQKERTPVDEARLKRLTAKEERISHGWEEYLLEGKTPSEGLARVFSRFKQWMTGIYKGVEGLRSTFRREHGEEIGLTDEVRSIFDRLLAEDDALEQARNDTEDRGSDSEAVKEMTPAEAQAYRAALVGSRTAAEGRVAKLRAELNAPKVSEARSRIAAEVAAELDQQPLYRAQRYLQLGELVDESGRLDTTKQIPVVLLDKTGEPYKLNRKDFIDVHGAELARQMPRGVFGKTKNAGVAVEQLAPLFGFEDGKALVDAFTKKPPREQALAEKTQARVEAELGPQLKQLADVALAAVHNDDALRATVMELRARAKQLDPSAAARVRSLDLPTLKEHVARLVGEMTVGALDPVRYARTERTAALKAAELWGAGKKEQSLDQGEARLLNQVLFREARDTRDELEKAQSKLEKTSEDTRAKLGLADPAYRDVHDQVLAAVGFGAAPAEGGKTLDQLLQLAESSDQAIAFDVDAIRSLIAKPKEWDSLTVDEARNVADAVTNLRHLAKATRELDLSGKKQSKDTWFERFAATVAKRKPLPPAPSDKAAEGLGDKLKHLGRGADALLIDVAETYSHMLDVGDREGPVSPLLVDARLEARNLEVQLAKDVGLKISEKWDNVPKAIRKLRDQRVDVAELLPVPPGTEGRIAPVYTRSTLWMLFLNWGNEGNRQRVRDGNDWTDANVEKALSKLEPSELKFLQGILDTIQSLYPQVAAVHEKRTGLQLGKVEATPLVLNGETYGGGYFPLKVDRRFETRAAELAEDGDIKSLFGSSYSKAFTPSSHRKARAQAAVYPVDMSWGVVPAHLMQVIHDISYGEWVRQAGGVMLDPRFKALTAQYLGPDRAKEFVPWLRDVANARADSAAGVQGDFIDKAGAFARNRAAIAIMGANLPAIGQQILDPWNAAQEHVPAHHIAAAYVKVNAMLAGAQLPELQLSKELPYRDALMKDNLRTKLNAIGPSGKGAGHVVSEVSFALYELSDRYTSRVTWKAAFDHTQTEGLPQEEAAKRADDVVRRIYASHDVAEKPPIMRTKRGLASVIMFHSFANRLHNANRRNIDSMLQALGDKEIGTMDKGKAVYRYAAALLMLGLTGAACAYIAGRGPKKDEDAVKWLAWKVALEPGANVPFVNATVDTLRGNKSNPRTAPELALLQQTVEQIGDLAGRGSEDRAIAAAEGLAGLMLNVPNYPVRAADTAVRLGQGKTKTRPKNAVDAADKLIYGEKSRPVHTPLGDVADLVGR